MSSVGNTEIEFIISSLTRIEVFHKMSQSDCEGELKAFNFDKRTVYQNLQEAIDVDGDIGKINFFQSRLTINEN